MIALPSRRFFAYILDTIFNLIIVCTVAIMTALIVPSVESVLTKTYTIFELPQLILKSLDNVYAIYLIIPLVSPIVLQIFFWSKGSSLGKKILKMTVVDKNTNEPIKFWKMAFREIIVKKVSNLFFGLGYIWIFIEKDNQAWHDKILDTVVVQRS